jgi:hypothetical protein
VRQGIFSTVQGGEEKIETGTGGTLRIRRQDRIDLRGRPARDLSTISAPRRRGAEATTPGETHGS